LFLSTSTNQEDQKKNKIEFVGVETGQATLLVTAHWDNATAAKGTSEISYDVSKFTHELLDALQPPKTYETLLNVPITSMSEDSDENKETLCTASFKVLYTPSIKDIREELCELIGKSATTKAQAREELRKAALLLHQLNQSSSTSTTVATKKTSSAISAGFLQKEKSTKATTTNAPPKPPAWYMVWYERTTIFVPVLKNYVFFIGFTMVSHFYGHHLAIPAPV
jgi:hypothetical protein